VTACQPSATHPKGIDHELEQRCSPTLGHGVFRQTNQPVGAAGETDFRQEEKADQLDLSAALIPFFFLTVMLLTGIAAP
jgi:hypothetical protein